MNRPPTNHRRRSPARRARMGTLRLAQGGQSTIEYIIITAFSVLVLIEGGQSSVVQSLVNTLKDIYKGFTFATSFATGFNFF